MWTGSEFEVDKLGFKFKGEESYQSVECIGNLEEEMTAKSVTKSCRGVVRKRRTKGTGEGTLKLTAHIPYAVYTKAFGMELDSLVKGVKAYGRNSVHPEISIVAHVVDEDDNEKLKAYPNSVVTTGVTRKIENGAEEVAEIELEIGVMPDAYGNGLYEVAVEDLEDDSIAEKWMTEFNPDMVQVATA